MQNLHRLSLLVLLVLFPMVSGQTKRLRLPRETPPGQQVKLSLGTLFVPASLAMVKQIPLFLHFHGPGWIAEVAAAQHKLAVIHAQLGTGSRVYGKPFADPTRLERLLVEAEKQSGKRCNLVGLTEWSAGYGAIRAILREEKNRKQVKWVVLMDGLHAGYDEKKNPDKKDLDCYLTFAREAAHGDKKFLVTHTKIVPGTYASTTECANSLLAEVSGKRQKPLTKIDLPVESEYQCKGFIILGCAGNTAADHVDHLHALPALIEVVLRSAKR